MAKPSSCNLENVILTNRIWPLCHLTQSYYASHLLSHTIQFGHSCSILHSHTWPVTCCLARPYSATRVQPCIIICFQLHAVSHVLIRPLMSLTQSYLATHMLDHTISFGHWCATSHNLIWLLICYFMQSCLANHRVAHAVLFWPIVCYLTQSHQVSRVHCTRSPCKIVRSSKQLILNKLTDVRILNLKYKATLATEQMSNIYCMLATI